MKGNASRRPVTTKGLRKADYEVLAAFRRELRRYLAFSERAAEAAGLPAQQYQALLAIKGYPGRDQVTVGELARELLIAQHSASELADRLVIKGLLARSADERDRRRTLLALTPEAESVLGRLAATHLEELRRVRPSLLELFDSFTEDRQEREGATAAEARD
ncbi:MAG: MarR family transcriptional regulator [Rhodospirillales bacterium]|nr:MarR family transcriptional regulator [Rhodospirillales bacterium]